MAKKKIGKKPPESKNANPVVPEPSYSGLVAANKEVLEAAGLLKVAVDAARLLDDPMFAVPDKPSRYGVHERREAAFDALCSILVRVGLNPPPLELALIKAFAPAEPKEADVKHAATVADHVKRVCACRVADAAEILPLAKALGAFECTSPWSSLDAKGLMSLINVKLLAKGLEPLRPDYAAMQLETAEQRPAPQKPVCVVVVDDNVNDLLKTALALAGWPGVDLVLFRYCKAESPSPETMLSVEDEIGDVARRVAALKPDVVLMDEGLCGRFEGHALVPAIRALMPDVSFVANTGGMPDALNDVGARGNCEKGRNLRDVQTAILSRR